MSRIENTFDRLIQYAFWSTPGVLVIVLVDSITAIFVAGVSPTVLFYVLFGTVLRVPVYALTIGWAALVNRRAALVAGLVVAMGTLTILYFTEWRDYEKSSSVPEWMLANAAYLLATCAIWTWWFWRELGHKESRFA